MNWFPVANTRRLIYIIPQLPMKISAISQEKPPKRTFSKCQASCMGAPPRCYFLPKPATSSRVRLCAFGSERVGGRKKSSQWLEEQREADTQGGNIFTHRTAS